MDNTEYQKGYVAGRKKADKDRKELKALRLALDEQKERVYMKCLELVVRECGGWAIDSKEIKNAQGYCSLAKIFADTSIFKLNS